MSEVPEGQNAEAKIKIEMARARSDSRVTCVPVPHGASGNAAQLVFARRNGAGSPRQERGLECAERLLPSSRSLRRYLPQGGHSFRHDSESDHADPRFRTTASLDQNWISAVGALWTVRCRAPADPRSDGAGKRTISKLADGPPSAITAPASGRRAMAAARRVPAINYLQSPTGNCLRARRVMARPESVSMA